MKDIPKIIYLQVDNDSADAESFTELETTYCEDKIYDNDIEYRLSKDFEKLEQLNAEMLEVLKKLKSGGDIFDGALELLIDKSEALS